MKCSHQINQLLELLRCFPTIKEHTSKLKHQESHRQAFIKLNKNAPYGQGAGQMNKPLKKKNQSLQLLSVCLPGAGATRDLIDAGRCGETLRREESDNFMFR